MDYGIVAGDTDKTIYFKLRDSTTGLGKTGLAFNSAGAVASYTLPGAARAAITLATQTVTGAHSDGGFVEVDATNCKGLYRLDLPDAAIASGAFTIIDIEFDGTIEESQFVPLTLRKSDVRQNAGTAITSSAGRQEVNTTHAAGTAWNSGAIGASTLASDTIAAAKIATGAITNAKFAAGAIDAAALATDAAQEIRNAITGGAYALDTDANGRIRIVDGTAAGEINTNAGAIALVDLVTLATTVTNLTNAATNGDLTATMKASVNTEVDAAIETYHLDHLLAVAYDPNSKPGAADALLNELVENDGGVARFSANSLEEAPSGTGASAASIVEAMFNVDTGLDEGDAVAGSVVYEIVQNAGGGGGGATAQEVWEYDIAAIVTANLAATVLKARASQTSVDAIDSEVGTIDSVVDSILAAVSALPTQSEITGGAYALSTDANGRVRIVDGTGTGELNTSGGFIAGIAGTINTLDALDTAQDSQHATTHAAVTASAIRTALGLGSANLDTQLDALPTAAENAAALLDLSNGIETGVTPRQAFRAMAAKAAGLISGAGTGTEVVKGIGQGSGGTTRLTATVDSSGNISAWTLNL